MWVKGEVGERRKMKVNDARNVLHGEMGARWNGWKGDDGGKVKHAAIDEEGGEWHVREMQRWNGCKGEKGKGEMGEKGKGVAEWMNERMNPLKEEGTREAVNEEGSE